MNNKRRALLIHIQNEIEELKSLLSSVREEEQESFDNMPESFQDSERGQNSMSAIDYLDSAADSLDDCFELINEAIQ